MYKGVVCFIGKSLLGYGIASHSCIPEKYSVCGNQFFLSVRKTFKLQYWKEAPSEIRTEITQKTSKFCVVFHISVAGFFL